MTLRSMSLGPFACLIFGSVIPMAAQDAGGTFTPGGRELARLEFGAAAELPRTVRLVSGKVAVAERDGARMLAAHERTILLVTLPEVLPAQFTLEFDLVPRDCICLPPDLMFETTMEANRGPGSVEVEWLKNGVAMIGGGPNQEVKAPEGLAESLQGTLVQVKVSVDGTRFRLFTNETELVSQERKLVRSRYLRITLGGNGEAEGAAVYLARVRVAAGGGTVAPVVVTTMTPATATGMVMPAPGPAPSAPPVSKEGPPPSSQPTSGGGAPAGSPTSGSTPDIKPIPSLDVQIDAQGRAKVTWGAVSGASAYYAGRWLMADMQCCANASSTTAPLTTPGWQDVALPKVGKYAFQVVAVSSTGGPLAVTTIERSWGGSTSVVAPPPAPSPAPLSPPLAPRTVSLSGFVAVGGFTTLVPRTIDVSGFAATGGFSSLVPRTITLSGFNAAGAFATIAPRVLTLSGFSAAGSFSALTPRELALTGFTAVGTFASLASRTVMLSGFTATGSFITLPARTITLPGWTAVGSTP